MIIMFTTSIVTYMASLLIPRMHNKKIGLLMFLGVVLSLLIYGKYTNFILQIIGTLVAVDIKSVTLLSMVGVSYYVFSGISYIVDIYMGKDEADKSFLDTAIWISFFPKIIAGPIERHKNFKKGLENIEKITLENERIKRGFLILSWGYFQKIVIADRIGLFVDYIYQDLDNQRGLVLFITMLLYSIQIYMDFAGYSNIAYGAAYILGINITKNFKYPYFTNTVGDFWQRWHISLSTWLRDYIYIPLGGNRKGKVRTYINLLVTFLISGIWHGPSWNYIFWGGLHGCCQIFEKICGLKGERKGIESYVTNFLLISFMWIFFRAQSIKDAFVFIKNMMTEFNPWILFDGTLMNVGLDIYDWRILLLSLMLAFCIEMFQFKNVSIYDKLQEQRLIVRWLAYYIIIISLLIFGIYGVAYDASNFIYFQY